MRLVALALLVSTVALTPDGRIGPLHVDRSTRAAVIAFMGRPQVERHMYGYFQKGDLLDALGYRCATSHRRDGFRVANGTAPCLTVFWIDLRTGKLGNAYLADPRFADPHGIHVGTPSATAERLLHQRLTGGCVDALHERTLTVLFEGGHYETNPTHLAGAHVYAFVVDGHQNTGLFECW